MTDSAPARGITDRTLTLRSSSGDPMAAIPVIPAGLTLMAALAMAPRLTATAAVGAMFARISLSLD